MSSLSVHTPNSAPLPMELPTRVANGFYHLVYSSCRYYKQL